MSLTAKSIWPPCVRVMVVRSPVLQVGTLFIITADCSATFGRFVLQAAAAAAAADDKRSSPDLKENLCVLQRERHGPCSQDP